MTPQEAFLELLAWSEGTSTSPLTQNSGYDVIVTSVDGPAVFTDYSDHPFSHMHPVLVRRNPPLESTAAGRYQILLRFWRAYKLQLDLPDFSPASQDKAALQQIRERGALGMIADGEIAQAIAICSGLWASLPGNHYAQPGGKTLDELLSKYAEFLLL